jgi:ParB-like chromosome segregation protein Spo0J
MTDSSEFITPVDAVSASGPRPGGAGRLSKRVRSDSRKASRLGARIGVRWLPVEALRPDGRNARIHSDRQVARIADSIAAFGFNVPVLIDGNGGVLAGHGRVLAARRLGLQEVPTIALDHLDEAQRRAFMLADNRLGELASWDEARLGLELKGLKILDLDLALSATGFELSVPRIKMLWGLAAARSVILKVVQHLCRSIR